MWCYLQLYILHFSILNFNKSFLALLHSRLRELGPDASIGDLFIGMVRGINSRGVYNYVGYCYGCRKEGGVYVGQRGAVTKGLILGVQWHQGRVEDMVDIRSAVRKWGVCRTRLIFGVQ